MKKNVQRVCRNGNLPYLCTAFGLKARVDSLAQLVEHSTFNAGVLGSSPRRITEGAEDLKRSSAFLLQLIHGARTQLAPFSRGLGGCKQNTRSRAHRRTRTPRRITEGAEDLKRSSAFLLQLIHGARSLLPPFNRPSPLGYQKVSRKKPKRCTGQQKPTAKKDGRRTPMFSSRQVYCSANYFAASTDTLRNSFMSFDTSKAALRARVPAALLPFSTWSLAFTWKSSI